MDDEPIPTPEQGIAEDPDSHSEPGHHRRRKRKVKRSSRIKRKIPFLIVLATAWLLLWAIWYYLVNRASVPPG